MICALQRENKKIRRVDLNPEPLVLQAEVLPLNHRCLIMKYHVSLCTNASVFSYLVRVHKNCSGYSSNRVPAVRQTFDYTTRPPGQFEIAKFYVLYNA
jgi:hypothetical protein